MTDAGNLRRLRLTDLELELIDAILSDPLGSFEAWAKATFREEITAKTRAYKLADKVGIPEGKGRKPELARWCLKNEAALSALMSDKEPSISPQDPSSTSFPPNPATTHDPVEADRPTLIAALRTATHSDFVDLLFLFSEAGQWPLHERRQLLAPLWERIHRLDASSGAAALFMFHLTNGDDPTSDIFREAVSVADFAGFPPMALRPLTDSSVAQALTVRLLDLMNPPRDGLPSLYFLQYLGACSKHTSQTRGIAEGIDACISAYFTELDTMWRWTRCQSDPLAWPTFLVRLHDALEAYCSPIYIRREELLPSPLSADARGALLRDLCVLPQTAIDPAVFGRSKGPVTCWEFAMWLLLFILTFESDEVELNLNIRESVDFYHDIVVANLDYIRRQPQLDPALHAHWASTAKSLRIPHQLRLLALATQRRDSASDHMLPEVLKLFSSLAEHFKGQPLTDDQERTLRGAFLSIIGTYRDLSDTGELPIWDGSSEHSALLLSRDDPIESFKHFMGGFLE